MIRVINDVEVIKDEFKGEICNIFTGINNKMTIICRQRLKKYAKMKYRLPCQHYPLLNLLSQTGITFNLPVLS